MKRRRKRAIVLHPRPPVLASSVVLVLLLALRPVSSLPVPHGAEAVAAVAGTTAAACQPSSMPRGAETGAAAGVEMAPPPPPQQQQQQQEPDHNGSDSSSSAGQGGLSPLHPAALSSHGTERGEDVGTATERLRAELIEAVHDLRAHCSSSSSAVRLRA
jgi:hypothetical protein